MSRVADVIISCSLLEEFGGDDPDGRAVPALTILNGWLREKGKSAEQGLVRVDDYAGGFKAMQCVIAIGAFNYLDIGAFLKVAWSLNWGDPQGVQIMIKDEEDELFSVYRFGEEKTRRT